MYLDFFEAARYLASKGLVSASSGNLSHVFTVGDKKNMWVTASGSWFENFGLDDLVECSFPEGVVQQSRKGKSPTSELAMHLQILWVRSDVNTVLHFQAPYATVLAASDPRMYERDINTIPEVPYYLGEIGIESYYAPGSKELADAVSERIKTVDAIMLMNHGQIVVGKSLEDVVQKTMFFELACMTVVLGKGIMRLNEAQRSDLVAYRKKKEG
jgi:ribulose-5-phosphate 4-epimerase/fuculose-1-phosphate aldolase